MRSSVSALSATICASQLEKQRENLATLYQRTATALPAGESAALEAQIRELHEQISSQTALLGQLTLERSQSHPRPCGDAPPA